MTFLSQTIFVNFKSKIVFEQKYVTKIQNDEKKMFRVEEFYPESPTHINTIFMEFRILNENANAKMFLHNIPQIFFYT